MLALLASLSAFAVPAEDCAPMYVSDSLPRPGQTDVPIDADITVFFAGMDCGWSETYVVELWNGTVLEASGSYAGAAVSVSAFATLDPPELLQPETFYVVHVVASDGWGIDTEFSFTTGTDLVTGIDGVPAIAIVSSWTDPDGYAEADLLVTVADDPDGLSRVRVVDGDDASRVFAGRIAPEAGSFGATGWWPPIGAQRDEVCVQAIQTDGAGTESTSDVVCAIPDLVEPVEDLGSPGPCGCSGTSAAPSFAPLAGLLLLRRRRVWAS
jgi:hypothetical protein